MSRVSFASNVHEQPPARCKSHLPQKPKMQLGAIQHMSYSCPGFAGAGSGAHQLVEPRTFRSLYEQEASIVIPLFQRRYCWSLEEGTKWFTDTVKTKTSSAGQAGFRHGVGKAFFVRDRATGALVCIDGQQRITTSMLLLLAIRDELLQSSLHEHCRATAEDLVASIHAVLFSVGREEVDEWIRAKGNNEIDWWAPMPFIRLKPSYADRAAFHELLLRPLLIPSDHDDHLVAVDYSEWTCESQQYDIVKNVFAPKIRTFISNAMATRGVLDTLGDLVTKVLDEMYLMYIECLNEINISQVFHWLQEKSIFGFGAILYNPAPGVAFAASDLVRNLLLAPVMNLPLAEQEELHQRRWIQRLEVSNHRSSRVTPKLLDMALEQLVVKCETAQVTEVDLSTNIQLVRIVIASVPSTQDNNSPRTPRYVGDFETSVRSMIAALGHVLNMSTAGVVLYARFHSVRELLLQSGIHSEEAIAEAVIEGLAAHVTQLLHE